MDLAGAVRGEHDDRRLLGADGTELGDAHLVGREDLEEEGLELVVGPVDLVDQQHARTLLEGPKDWPGQEEPGGEQVGLNLAEVDARPLPVPPGRRLDRAQVEDLPREVPVVERLRGVDALVALEPDQRDVQAERQRLG